MAAHEVLFVGPLLGCLQFQLSLPGRLQPFCFSQPGVMLASFSVLVLFAGVPSLGFRSQSPQLEPPQLKYPSRTSAAVYECLTRPFWPPVSMQSPLSWLSGFSPVSPQLIIQVFLLLFVFCILIIIPIWSWERASVASIYSPLVFFKYLKVVK